MPISKPSTPFLSKEQISFLLLEGISPTAQNVLRQAGYSQIKTEKKALDPGHLKTSLEDVRFLGIRSRTQLTADVFDASTRLAAVGCFSVGTNQVDLEAARLNGIPVFNAPFSNTRSVAELTIAEIVMLYRRVFPRSQGAHIGDWQKSAIGSREVRGKTLGIVGYGNIGTQLAYLGEAMGMRVVYFDRTDKLRHGNAQPVSSLTELLETSDVVSLHVPETPETQNMIQAEQLARMKKGAFLINNARGTAVDIAALAEALKSGHLAGAAVDVFPTEPASNSDTFTSPLQGLENVILTPHVGGSTEEAQERIGEEVARKLVAYSDIGSTEGAVNFPQVQLPPSQTGTRFIQVQRNLPGELGRLNDVFAKHSINIAGQYYQTDGEIGYVVLDADTTLEQAQNVVKDVRSLDGTIRARVLSK